MLRHWRLSVVVVLLILMQVGSSTSALADNAILRGQRTGGVPPVTKTREGIGTVTQPLAAAQGSIWPTNQIPVCWENPKAADADARQRVQKQIGATWEANSNVKFSGWGTCQSGSKGIRISIETGDTRPHTSGLGAELDGKHSGMSLNFVWKGCGASYGVECVEWVATHEFGHALGFTHEQNRSDAPLWCRDEGQGSKPSI